MKISDIKCCTINGLYGDWILVRVCTDEGIDGFGEAFPTGKNQGGGVREMVLWMKTLLVGEDPENVDKLWQKMYQRQIYRGCSMAGALTTAISGVEIALWDILGKAHGVPIYKLLGGKHRDKIRVYSDFDGRDEKDYMSTARRAKEIVDMGFTALKMDVDLYMWRDTQDSNHPMTRSELNHIRNLVGAVREYAGDDIDIAVDCHSGFTTADALKVADALEPFNLMWLEEPVPPKDLDAMARINHSTKTPICAGENWFTQYEFRDVFAKQAVDIVMPDIQKCGGILCGKRIADLAAVNYTQFAPHCVASPIGQMASVQLCASVANFLILEWHMIDTPWWNEIIKTDAPIVSNGCIDVPEEPGVGIELNKEAIMKYMISGEDFFD